MLTPTETATVTPTPTATITPATATIESLITTLEGYCQGGQIDNQGICNSLQGKLNKAQKYINQGKPDKAVKELQAFVNEVEAQRGKHIIIEAADWLIDIAGQLITQLQG